MASKKAEMTIVGKGGGKVTQRDWDAQHARRVAKTLRTNPDIKSVTVKPQR